MPDDSYSSRSDLQLPAILTAPGLTIRSSYSLGGDNRILQFEQTIDADKSESEILRLSESLTRVGDVIRAKFELPALRRQRKGVQDKHDENTTRQVRSQSEVDAYKEARLDKAREIDADYKTVYEKAYEEHARSGRQSAFVPQGATKSKLAALKNDAAQLAEPVGSQEQDCLRRLAEVAEEIKQGERALAQLDELINEAERLARGEDISGV